MRLTAWLWMGAAAIVALPLAAVAAPGKAYGRSSDRQGVCSWDRPGHNPYTGGAAAALARYTDIPAAVRQRLQRRMNAHEYEDIAVIRRDSIEGKHGYRPEIRDMHFGANRVCKQVTRDGWTPRMEERGLVYCDSGHCILVPTVCGNVSRVARRPEAVAPAQAFGDEDPVAALVPAPPLLDSPASAESFEQLVALLPPGAGPEPVPVGAWAAPVGAPAPSGFIFTPRGLPRPPGGGSLPPSDVPSELPPLLPPMEPPILLPPISPVPEPSTWLMMVCGLGLLAWRALKRREESEGRERVDLASPRPPRQ